METRMEARIARLEADVAHIRSEGLKEDGEPVLEPASSVEFVEVAA